MFKNIDIKKIFIFLLIIILIGVAIYFIFFREKEKLPEELPTKKHDYVQYVPSTEEICQQKKTEKEKQICLDSIKIRSIIEEKNIKKCLEIETLTIRDDCLLKLAAEIMLNDDLCFSIADDGKRAVCIDKITIIAKDVNLCKKHFKGEPFEYQECEDRILAFKISESGKIDDIKECLKIKSLEYPNLCLQNSFRNKFDDDCQKVPSEVRDLCISHNILLSAKTQEDCSLIKLENYKKFCLLKIEAGDDRQAISKIDSDNDGFSDGDELFTGTDLENPDTDSDGLMDGEEIFTYLVNPKEKDTDSDGLDDYEEIKTYQTNPNKPDTDGDGVLDGEEIENGTDPVSGDKDRDGLLDELEAKIGTDPDKKDTDGDGMEDGYEWKSGFDPLKEGEVLADTDKDGLLDIDENFYGTDRLNPDTDGDGVNDKKEVDELTNPLGTGDMDFDGDGLTDKKEEEYGTNPSLPDTDDDGVLDGDEIKNGTDPKVKG